MQSRASHVPVEKMVFNVNDVGDTSPIVIYRYHDGVHGILKLTSCFWKAVLVWLSSLNKVQSLNPEFVWSKVMMV